MTAEIIATIAAIASPFLILAVLEKIFPMTIIEHCQERLQKEKAFQLNCCDQCRHQILKESLLNGTMHLATHWHCSELQFLIVGRTPQDVNDLYCELRKR